MKKKLIIFFAVCLLVLAIITILISHNKNQNNYLDGRWISDKNELIKIVKEYKNGQPEYANENILEYWLDIKKDSTYILFFNDIDDKSRSNYNIEKNIFEKGKYNFDYENGNIIYFSPQKKYDRSIWTCEIENGNKLYNCTNYAYDFLKNK